MKENKNLTKEEYLKIKSQAGEDLKQVLDISPADRYIIAYNNAQKMFANIDSEEAAIYISNFLIPDDKEFIQAYNDNGHMINKIAEHYTIKDSRIAMYVITARIIDINKYYQKYVLDQPKNNEVIAETPKETTNIQPETVVQNNETNNSAQPIVEGEKSELDLLKDELLRVKSENEELRRTNTELTNQNNDLNNRLTAVSKIIPLLQNVIDNVPDYTKEK